ncbi:MAG: STAS domain-containing protein [Pirellulales bacterium]|nr:STAS domain-containing protein [Pirellulales bacterium]
MQLPTEIFGEVVVVHAPDQLGGLEVDQFVKFMSRIEPKRVVLDLDNVEVIDSAGLTAILDVQDQLRTASGDLRIATNNQWNRKILEITRLSQGLDVFDSVIEAVKSYRQVPAGSNS